MSFMPRNYAGGVRVSFSSQDISSSFDKVALVSFGEKAQALCPFTSPDDRALKSAVESLSKKSGFATNLSGALRLGNHLLSEMPSHFKRTIWVLTDGVDNVFTSDVFPQARRAKELDIAIHTVGIGEDENFDEYRLMAVSSFSAGGQYVPMSAARSLGMAFYEYHHRDAEATVYCVDTSTSMMVEPSGTDTKIRAVQDTLHDLIRWKRVI
ncbi:vWA domain-containing protein [Rhizobium sp. CCGE 510]|uniref:vWA domain-containing protein n=1 Tax=Rhizobium sp. CCGE 510 TaxID=1132836 RepID=UPI00027B7E73|nr:vWA domain-containing protein [Rhizobium sp. CCGE 510]EJT04947.1 von willebrand factor type a [Rhizobium sp. CCGE 510]